MSILENAWVPVLILHACATTAFTWFVQKATGKQLLQSILYSALLQAISVLAYGLLFAAVASLSFMVKNKSAPPYTLYIPALALSLISVFPVNGLAAKTLLRLITNEQTKTVWEGNVVVALLLWTGLWLAPF